MCTLRELLMDLDNNPSLSSNLWVHINSPDTFIIGDFFVNDLFFSNYFATEYECLGTLKEIRDYLLPQKDESFYIFSQMFTFLDNGKTGFVFNGKLTYFNPYKLFDLFMENKLPKELYNYLKDGYDYYTSESYKYNVDKYISSIPYHLSLSK